MYFPFLPSGTPSTFFSKTRTSRWGGPWGGTAWAWRVNCRTEPQISSVGTPTIGRRHVIRLTNAKADADAFLAIGTQRISFPFPGAPGCFLLNDAAAVFLLRTNASGSANFPEPVPNDRSLLGTKWPHQFAVIDPVNAAKLVFSAGGEVRL